MPAGDSHYPYLKGSGEKYKAIRRRRKLFRRLYHEAIITHQHGKGISFTDVLIQTDCCKEALMYVPLNELSDFVSDRPADSLKDLVVRTGTNRLVTDVRSISYRRFLAMRQQAHRNRRPRYDHLP